MPKVWEKNRSRDYLEQSIQKMIFWFPVKQKKHSHKEIFIQRGWINHFLFDRKPFISSKAIIN